VTARAFLACLRLPVGQRAAAPMTLLLAAHPDDEVLGVGGQMEWLGPSLHVVHLTPGIPIALDPEQRRAYESAEAYGRCRASELDAVLNRARIPSERRHRMSGADQRCARRLVRLTCELRDLLRRLSPDVLLTHPYEGGHPDHDAAAFIAQTACRLLPAAPGRLEFTSYHSRDGRFQCAAFLPGGNPGTTAYLDGRQLAFKRTLMAEYVSQQQILAQFRPEIERVRVAPEYDFGEPPHPPPLHYEVYPWGVDGPTFRSLAADAGAALAHSPETACA
jgi:N-acetylglucosamine malate deacetylase 2